MTPRTRRIVTLAGIIFAGMALLLIIALVGAALYISSPRFSDTAGRWLSDKSGRRVDIGNQAEFHIWQREPHVVLREVKIGNAPWAKEEAILQADKVEFSIRPLGLLRGRLVIPLLILDQPRIHLEKNAQGEANWDFTENPAAALVTQPLPDKRADIPLVSRLIISGGTLTYRDPAQHIDTTLEISTVRDDTQRNENIEVSGKGTFQRALFTLTLSGASVLQLRENNEPYPFTLHAAIGATVAEVRGTVQDPVKMQALDVTLSIKGASAADLFPLTGIALPRTPPYSVKGRLTRDDNVWKFSEFAGGMGDSDLKGSLAWHPEQNPPYLEAKFRSDNLDMKDMAPFIGADKRPADETRVIPDMPLDISRLMAMNADISFESKSVKAPALLENFLVKAHLEDGTLQLKPVSFGIAKGTIASDITIKGKETPPHITLHTKFTRLQLDDLFAPLAKRFGKENVSAGLLGGTVRLQGSGKSLHEMLAKADGEAGFGMEGGSLSKLLLELAGLDLFRAAGLIVSGRDDPIPIQCVIAHFGAASGVMTTREFLVETEITTLRGEGTVNLRDETMDLEIKTYPKKPTLISARSPIHVRGTFKKPSVGIRAAALVLRGGAAAALAVLTPPAALIAFIGPGLENEGSCSNFVKTLTPKGEKQ